MSRVKKKKSPLYLLYPNSKLLRPGGRNRRQQLHQHPETLYRLRLRSGLVSCGHSASRSHRGEGKYFLLPLLRKTSDFDSNWRRLLVRSPLFHPGSWLLFHVFASRPREIEQQHCYSFVSAFIYLSRVQVNATFPSRRCNCLDTLCSNNAGSPPTRPLERLYFSLSPIRTHF